MGLAALKLADVAARSLFMLILLYALPDREAGQFGLTLTLIAWFMFLAGYERYVDLQRTLAGVSEASVDSAVAAAMRCFTFNQLALAPLMVSALICWVGLAWWMSVLYLLIAIAEHLSQEAYRLALMSHRHRIAMLPVVVKNMLLCAMAGAGPPLSGRPLDMHGVTLVWASVSCLALAASVAAVLMARRRPSGTDARPAAKSPGLLEQYRRSQTHFVIGLFGLASVQFDRFVTGALVPFEQSAVYFRHLLLASFVYSALSIASYNRTLPAVYRAVGGGQASLARSIIQRERMRLLFLACCIGALGATAHAWRLPLQIAGSEVTIAYLAVVLGAFLIRMWADFNSMLLNAAHQERDVLRVHAATLPLSILASVALTSAFGVTGAMAGFLVSALIYWAVSTYRTHKVLG